MMSHTAIVAGATGLIGRQVVKELLGQPFYGKVVALVRTPWEEPNEKCIQIRTDYTSLEEPLRPYIPNAHVFCCLGTTIKKAQTRERFKQVDYEYPMQLGRLAEKYKASQFAIVTAIGAHARSNVFYSRVKGEVEEDLMRLQLPALHIFRPSLLLGNREEFRFGEQIGMGLSSAISPLMAGPLRQYKPIPAEWVAKSMVKAVLSGRGGSHIYAYDQMAALNG
ncbi:NAD-dependent epimerase/dehydratase family protein [Paenibacillus allorhizosphaerae]|uniref:Oxidoreductase n=1 Tax=Paenibacillus allorhizosphaerae TaxID=2849866 RepID=A0ABM8VK19_9BACL|nr:NAD-dependent epimerase/dehydratase family protein [Paenibacillus allorhizosphaerae]CAG7646232.1 hypothetical protein PAECIP111802_03694 [Paenibacillus allorhizosphaerae]